MKNLFIFLVIFLCFPLVSLADNNVYISGVLYSRNGNLIQVDVQMTEQAKQQYSSVNFKVVPADRVLGRLLNDGVKYGMVSSDNPSTFVCFGCGEGADYEEAKQCRLYDFEVITVNCVKKQ